MQYWPLKSNSLAVTNADNTLAPSLLHWAQLTHPSAQTWSQVWDSPAVRLLSCGPHCHTCRCFPLESQNLMMYGKMSACCYGTLPSDKYIRTFLPLLISIQNLFRFGPHLCGCEWGLSWEAPLLVLYVFLLPAVFPLQK